MDNKKHQPLTRLLVIVIMAILLAVSLYVRYFLNSDIESSLSDWDVVLSFENVLFTLLEMTVFIVVYLLYFKTKGDQ